MSTIAMVSGRRPHNSKAPASIPYGGRHHSGAASIYRSVARPPTVSLATFTTRIRKLAVAGALTSECIDEALWLSAEDYQRKFGARYTLVSIDGLSIDLARYYEASRSKAAVSYRTFWQRIRALRQAARLDPDALDDALTMAQPIWISFHGGGRKRPFVYSGEEFPEQAGKRFHSVAAFLRSVDRYSDRALIWSRLKAGWNLDDALTIPTTLGGHRLGSIYKAVRLKTGEIYVGLTVTTVPQRWKFHVRRALSASATRLHMAIREDAPEGFLVEVLETDIRDPEQLREREGFWVRQLGALGPDGLNTAKPGGLGGPRGRRVEYDGEVFRSMNEAADVLSERLGIERHVILSRLQSGSPIPSSDRVRKHSKHPDAGSNLFRRWLGLLKRHGDAVDPAWANDYEQFKRDVSPVPADKHLVRTDARTPWGPGNFKWVSTQEKVERTHGKSIMVHGKSYPSLKAVADAHHIGVSTLQDRIRRQGMPWEQAVAAPLGETSYRSATRPITVDGRTFRSQRQAILYIARTRGLSEDQAKYRFTTGKI